MKYYVISACLLIIVYLIYNLCISKKEKFSSRVYADETGVLTIPQTYEVGNLNLPSSGLVNVNVFGLKNIL